MSLRGDDAVPAILSMAPRLTESLEYTGYFSGKEKGASQSTPLSWNIRVRHMAGQLQVRRSPGRSDSGNPPTSFEHLCRHQLDQDAIDHAEYDGRDEH